MSEVITDNLDLWTSALHTKSSAGRGKNGKQEAYGIKKLRELILELAVRGKLVPQDPSDEPAADLLKKIAEQKSRLIEQRKIKRQKSLPKVARDEPIFTVPHAWRWTRLGEITSYGITDKAESSDVEKETWVLELEDVEKETSKLLRKRRFSERPFLSSKNRFISGDVIYGKLRPYLDKVLVADENGVCTTEMVPMRGYANLNPFYIRLVMKSPQFIKYADDSTHGMNLPRLATDKAQLALFPLPPLAEQNRIVAKVDELMALCDQLEQQQTNSVEAHQTLVETLLGTLTSAASQQEVAEAWARIANHFDTLFTTEHSIDQLKQTILQLAVMGKLVPQDSNDKSATLLLQSIATEKAQLVKEGRIKKERRAADTCAGGTPFTLPDGWVWSELSHLLALVTDGDHQAPPQSDEGVPFLVIGNLNTGAICFDSCKYVRSDYYDKLDWGRKPIAGDLLYTVTGSFGIPVPVVTKEPFCVQRHVAILKATDSTPSRYLNLVLGSKLAIAYATSIATGIAQKTVPLTGLRRMPIPVPPEKEQLRIVAKVEELTVLCDALKVRLTDAQTTQIHLADAIVEQAVA